MSLTVKVITPESTLYDGPALAIGARNAAGPLSILPQHTNFISIVDKQLVIRLPDKTEKEIPIDQGILYCREDNIEIYIGISSAVELPEERKVQSEKRKTTA